MVSLIDHAFGNESPRQTFVASPPLVLDSFSAGNRKFHIVRDDLLAGGTKQRGLHGLLQEYKKLGYRKFAYASPFCGYAQIALSYLCRQMELECFLFCESLPDGSGKPHPYTLQAKAYGAKIALYSSLEDAHAELRKLDLHRRRILQIPLGFDCPEFNHHYIEALRVQWRYLSEKLSKPPQTLWLPVGSGTLVRNFSRLLEAASTKIHAVDVHVLPSTDHRIQDLQKLKNVKLFSAPQKFADPEKRPPAFPSNLFYDAKLKSFLEFYGQDGDVWWNVAK